MALKIYLPQNGKASHVYLTLVKHRVKVYLYCSECILESVKDLESHCGQESLFGLQHTKKGHSDICINCCPGSTYRVRLGLSETAFYNFIRFYARLALNRKFAYNRKCHYRLPCADCAG